MIGPLFLMLIDLERGVEIAGGNDWFAARIVCRSPLFGFELQSDWLAVPLEEKR